ncbi:hypothetical protein AAVH_04512 [Aphelenchoides avenae]|nr:hypothetical protein AAVH_04512 [Aphelenchus avenae]
MAPEAKKTTMRKRAKADDSQRQRNKKRDEKTAEKAPESEVPMAKDKPAKSKKKKGEKAKAATIEGVLPTEVDGDKLKTKADDKKAPLSKGTSKKKPSKGSKEKIDFKPKKKAATQETAEVEVPDKASTSKDAPPVRADTPGAKSDARQNSKRDAAKKGRNNKCKKPEKGKKKRTGKSYMEGVRDVIDEKLLDVDAVSPGSESLQGAEARTPVRSRYIDPGMKAEPASINADVLSTWAINVAKARVKPLLSEFLIVRKFLPENLETTHFLKHPQKNR